MEKPICLERLNHCENLVEQRRPSSIIGYGIILFNSEVNIWQPLERIDMLILAVNWDNSFSFT